MYHVQSKSLRNGTHSGLTIDYGTTTFFFIFTIATMKNSQQNVDYIIILLLQSPYLATITYAACLDCDYRLCRNAYLASMGLSYLH